MEISATQILILLLGLLLTFFGLIFYKGFIKLIGFAVGAGYGIYLFSVFSENIVGEPIFIYLVAGLLILSLGILGTYVAQFANIIMFFLTGGLVGVILGKILTGEVVEFIDINSFLEMIKPEGPDIIWFLGGGFIFILSIDALVMLVLSIFGAGLIWYAISPLNLLEHDWVIPLIIGILGLAFQESSRRRAKGRVTVPRLKHPPPQIKKE